MGYSHKTKMMRVMAYVRLLADNPGGMSDIEAGRRLGLNPAIIFRYRTEDLSDCVAPKLNRWGNPVFGKYVLVESKMWLDFAQAIIRAMSRSNR